jgi:N-acetylmuramoyl-L-alanine amidase
MMESVLIFSLKSAICSAVFVAYYLLALKNVQMNSFNRIYLLSAALFSLLLPFADLDIFNSISPVVAADFPLLSVTAKGTDEAFVQAITRSTVDWQLVLVTAYFTVSMVMVLMLIVKPLWVYSLKRKGETVKREGFVLVKTDDPRAPFSFMNMLFWPTHMRQDSPEGKGILMHELAHIRQYHTLDKIFMQFMLAVSWLNPFNWLIKKELWLQHEFLADKYAIKDRDSDAFARMLLYSVAGPSNRSVLSPFFQSPVKRRLKMLTQPSGLSYSFLRRFLSIPVLFTAILLLSANTQKPTSVLRSPEKIILVLDAAHGGKDGGGKSIYGYEEKDITMAISKKLVALSGEYNIEIITTRDEDASATLEERLHISNNAADAIFLSVHVNKSTANDVCNNNYQLGINPKGSKYDKSMLLASSIAGKLKMQQLPVDVVDQGKAYVIRENKHPAILMECGNIDDADNIALLKNDVRSEILCRNILSGIVDYNTRLVTK